jgi:hypothetical protein
VRTRLHVEDELMTVFGVAVNLPSIWEIHDGTREWQTWIPDGTHKSLFSHGSPVDLTVLTTFSASVHREVDEHLNSHGFQPSFVSTQYSVFHCNCTVMQAWDTMVSLREVRPRGILATVVRRLAMFTIPTPDVFIIMDDVRLGGVFSSDLMGPTPGLAEEVGEVSGMEWIGGSSVQARSGKEYILFTIYNT